MSNREPNYYRMRAMAVNAANMAEDFLRRRVEDGVPERPPCVKVKGPKDIDRITEATGNELLSLTKWGRAVTGRGGRMVLFIPTVVLDGDTRKLFHCSIEMGRRYEVFVDGDTVHAGTYACVDKKPMDKICFKTFGNEIGECFEERLQVGNEPMNPGAFRLLADEYYDGKINGILVLLEARTSREAPNGESVNPYRGRRRDVDKKREREREREMERERRKRERERERREREKEIHERRRQNAIHDANHSETTTPEQRLNWRAGGVPPSGTPISHSMGRVDAAAAPRVSQVQNTSRLVSSPPTMPGMRHGETGGADDRIGWHVVPGRLTESEGSGPSGSGSRSRRPIVDPPITRVFRKVNLSPGWLMDERSYSHNQRG